MDNKRKIFAAACVGMLLFGITLITLGSVTHELTQRFSLSSKDSGTIFSILPFGILIGSFLFGPVIDKYGYKPFLSLATFIMAIGFLGIANVPTIGWLKLAIFLFGLGGGIINGATNALVSDISEQQKGANLALLGIFFGVGAICMPLIIGVLKDIATSFQILQGVGIFTLVVAIFFFRIQYPNPKVEIAEKKKSVSSLFISPLLWCISMVLFFQSSLEAIINNWTTTYLKEQSNISEEEALFALSLHMAGMIAMRLLIGSIFRNWSAQRTMLVSFILLLVGIASMQLATEINGYYFSLILSGAGLAAGFPVLLGIAGQHFSEVSGKAFSMAFTVALLGNMLINYLVGHWVQEFGVSVLTTVCYFEIFAMALFFYFVNKQIHLSHKN